MEETNETLKEKIKNIALNTIFCIIYIFILYFSILLVKEGTQDVKLSFLYFLFVIQNSMTKYIVIPLLILLAIFFILKAILRDNLRTNIALTVITLTITLISYYKYRILGEPLIPLDILLIGNAGQIASFGLTWPPLVMWIVIAVLTALLILYAKVRRNENHEKHKITLKTDLYRIPLFFVGAFIIYYMCVSPARFENLGIKNTGADNYRLMGANAVFFIGLRRFLYTYAKRI